MRLDLFLLGMLRSLMLRTNYVIRVMRIKDKGDIDNRLPVSTIDFLIMVAY